MITTTHIVTNALISRARQRSDAGAMVAPRSFVLGGLAPDVGLLAMSLGAAVYYPLVRGLTLSETGTLASDDLFFNSPWWIVAHNALHAPLMLVGLGAVSLLTEKYGDRLRSFALGCAVHAVIDIAVHHDDGPLIGFPFDWNTRFQSPVSYWDPEHYGRWVQPIDLAITILGAASLWRSRRRSTA